MARKFKSVGSDWVEFIPEFDNNKDCKIEDRITCQVKLFTQADSDILMDHIISEQRNGKKNIKWSNAHFDLVNSHVKDIKNLVVETKEGEKIITTMEQLYNIPELKGLYTEIANILDNSAKLMEQEIKN